MGERPGRNGETVCKQENMEEGRRYLDQGSGTAIERPVNRKRW